MGYYGVSSSSSSNAAQNLEVRRIALVRKDKDTTFPGGAEDYERYVLRVEINEGAQSPYDHTSEYTKLFVWARRRVYNGGNYYWYNYFVRVATIGDLDPATGVPEDAPDPGSSPQLYRLDYMEMTFYGSQSQDPEADRTAAYAQLIEDVEVLAGALEQTAFTQAATYQVEYYDEPSGAGGGSSSSSSFVSAIVGSSSSSSYSKIVTGSSSSSYSQAPGQQSSSSSAIIKTLFTEEIQLAGNYDAAFIRHREGGIAGDTLYNDLDFVRVGRNPISATSMQTGVDVIVNEYYTTLLRFPIDINRHYKIVAASLRFYPFSTETEHDCILQIREIYADNDKTPIGEFTSIPTYVTFKTVNWAPVPGHASVTTTEQASVDISSIIKSFIQKDSYTYGDYLGLAIEEVISDPGARRDMNISTIKLAITYDISEKWYSSSSSPVPG